MKPQRPLLPSRLAFFDRHRSPRALVLALLGGALVLMSSLAGAQPQDAKSANAATRNGPKQNFWEAIYDPNRPAYEEAVDAAWNAAQDANQEQLETSLGELRNINKEAAATLYFEAIVAGKRGDHAASVKLLTQGLEKKDFRDLSAEIFHFDLALSQTRLGQYDAAIDAYQSCLTSAESNSHEDVYLTNMAELHMANDRLDEAIKLYRAALSRNSDYVHALFGLAIALERSGQHRLARGYLLKGLLLDPEAKGYMGPNTFFVPPIDRDFHAGMLAEEAGRLEDAVKHYDAFLKGSDGRLYKDSARAALGRVEKLGSLKLADAKLPAGGPTAWAADPKGRYVALGDSSGKLTLLRGGKVVGEGKLSQDGRVLALAFSADGKQLLAARADGTVEVFEPGRKLRKKTTLGPVKLPGGNRVAAIASNGGALLASGGGMRQWHIASRDKLEASLGNVSLPANARSMALGPWEAQGSGSMITAFWTQNNQLHVRRAPDSNAQDNVLTPPGGNKYHVVTLSADGRYAFLIGNEHIIVCRTVDMQIMRMVSIKPERAWGRPVAAVVDESGGAGHGAALVLLYGNHYAAFRLGSLLP